MENKLAKDVYFVGAIDKNRRLFDKLIPLPDGTSYNSYLVKGSEKTALIDTVDPSMSEVLLKNLDELGIKKIDYIVVNHAEQDHSGSLPILLKKYPGAIVLCSDKCKQMLVDLLDISTGRINVVMDNSFVTLGGKTLEFYYIPWSHWPETMCTYLKEDQILFSCDFFGSHFATEDILFFDESKIEKAAKRYYAEIMMPFRLIIRRNLEIVKKLKINMIAASHGPVYKNPEFILKKYEEWTSDKVVNKVVIAYVSMHASTEIMADYLYKKLLEKSIEAKMFELSEVDLGELASELVDCSVVLLGTPTVLTKMHPLANYALNLVSMLKPKAKYFGIFGSYGWGGRVVEEAKEMLKGLNPELLPVVQIKGIPKQKDFAELDILVEEISKRLK